MMSSKTKTRYMCLPSQSTCRLPIVHLEPDANVDGHAQLAIQLATHFRVQVQRVVCPVERSSLYTTLNYYEPAFTG